MTLPLRPLLALLASYVLVLSLQSSWGFFSTRAFLGAMAALVLAWTACQLPDRPGKTLHFRKGTQIALDMVLPIFSFCTITLFVVAAMSTQLMYADGRVPGWSLAWYPILASVALLLCLRADWRQEPTSWGYPLVLAAAFSLVLACRTDVLMRSPNPVIDVFAWLRDSADHLLAGQNPYTHSIETPYGTSRAFHYGVCEPPDPRPPAYPPIPILVSAVPRIVKWDVRWANIIAELLAAGAMAGVGWRRERPWLGLAAAVTFLNLPRSTWIIEQAWYEPMLAALYGLGFWLSDYSGWRRYVGGMMLGLGLTAKQFGLPLLFSVAGPLRLQWRSLLIGLAAAGLIMVPFIVAAPGDFFEIVVAKHMNRPPQYHSLTIGTAAFQWLNVSVPRWLTWWLAVALILSVSWRRADRPAVAALATGTSLLAFSLCHTQGYPNYFYLCNFLWLFAFVALLASSPKPNPMETSPK